MNLLQRRCPRVVKNSPSHSAISGAQNDRLSSIQIRQRVSTTGPAVFMVQEKDSGQLASEFRIAGLVGPTRFNNLSIADATQFLGQRQATVTSSVGDDDLIKLSDRFPGLTAVGGSQNGAVVSRSPPVLVINKTNIVERCFGLPRRRQSLIQEPVGSGRLPAAKKRTQQTDKHRHRFEKRETEESCFAGCLAIESHGRTLPDRGWSNHRFRC